MRRYIDADAFAEKMKRQYCESCDKYQGLRCNRCSCGDWLDDLDFEPTADVVEVVRCKDCEHGQSYNMFGSRYCLKHNDVAVRDNDYCSYGERAEE